MFECKNKIIKITKGDTAALTVNLTMNNAPYEMDADDVLTLTVRKKVGAPVLMSVSSEGSNTLYLSPVDTKKLEVGPCCFDIQLTTALGDVFTVVGLTDSMTTNMVVYPEVTV